MEEKKWLAEKETDQEKKQREDLILTPAFQKAIKNVPTADINLVKEKGCKLSEEEILIMIVANRWYNKICENCWNKEQPNALKRCSKCCLAFYCSLKCQKQDWNQHKLRCGQKDGPLDSGPQRLAFVPATKLDMQGSSPPKLGERVKFETS